MSEPTRAKACTFGEFCYLVSDDRKADLIDGVIYYEGPEDPATNILHLWLLNLLGEFVDEKELGRLFAFKVAFRLDDLNGPEPDIGFVRKDRLALVKREYVDGRPDLVVEITSAETAERDYRLKRKQYERAGVPEYCIVDDVKRKVTLLRLAANGRFREVRPRKGELRSEVLTGFRLRPEWLWQNPLPNKIDLLAEVLSRP